MQGTHGDDAIPEEPAAQRLAWEAPKLVALDLLSRAEKISWNTEHGVISGLS